ncbi:hypothetical protein APHAL10511_008570 [Amanita phalloides]|nr:hypothetical protein APHAL10511_008570 [Amanita phalloides]
MYRDWREVTKSLLSIKSKSGRMYSSNLPKSKMRRPETIVYVNWVIKEINQNPEAFQHYQNNKGIIKAREVFLERLASNEGKNIAEDAKRSLCPWLFQEAARRRDNVRTSKKLGPVFVENVMNLLQSHDVVIADKCEQPPLTTPYCAPRGISQICQERRTESPKKKGKKAREDGEEESELPMRVRLLALYWDVSSQPYTDVFRICADRVRERGEGETYEDVIWQFIRSREELLPSEVDGIIEMQLGEGLEESVRRAVEGIVI